MYMKQCAKCKKDKPITDYAPHSLNADGLSRFCMSCRGTLEPVEKHVALLIRTSYREWEVAAVALEYDAGSPIHERFKALFHDPEYFDLLRKLAETILEITNQ